MSWLVLAILFVVALVVTILLTPLAGKLAKRLDAVDYPSARRVNKQPTPRMGGIAMMAGLTVALAVYCFGVYVLGWHNDFLQWRDASVNVVGVACGVLFIFLVGAVDDVHSLNPKVKLLLQVVAACIVAASGLLFESFHNPLPGGGYVHFGVWAYPITVFYLVAFANVINLIDGLDGLAAGITTISCITLLILSLLTGANAAAVLSVMLMGACIGFLRYNTNPASIFMGDSGALTLGFMLGIISLFGSARTAMIMSMFVPIIAAGVPIVDTTLAIIRRTLAHRPIDEADKGHIHHRLLQSGYTQKTTVHIMWAWTAVLAACGLLIMEFDGPIRLVAFLVAFGVTFYGIRKLHLLKPVLAHHYSHRKDGEWTELTTQEFEAARVREQLEKAAAEKAAREEREATGSDGRHAR